ncbi:LysR family transcriptional regulator [Actinoplanes ianthinogenes]|uniref:LysR family transcriptional regulator n=1 Tax=Actinoplanes ianthinogenes TaxID=122358 RepID=A0ABN6CUQ4_9ACTN|nr:LysR family transcriptional regulator [Actinoplanes ianthinogenes]BCJ47274.1 LysR family transcriptional regulator [Actinoplanes ianthinogenes]GGR42330.1 LysR family transcriptional regulator [Actinoplanes ianthinogenes]
MAPSLDLLRTFLAVHREGSLTRAAQRLSLSQPAVTAQLRTLEEQLGRPLFTRLPRGVVPTAAGELLARRIAEPLDQLSGLLDAGLDQPASLAGVVHLGGPAEFVTARVMPALAGLVERGLELRVVLGVADDLLRALLAGAVDLTVQSVRPKQRGLRVQPLCDEEFVLVAAEPWASRVAAAGDVAAALARTPQIAYAEELPIIRRYWQTVFEVRPPRDAAVVVPNLHAVLAAVVAGAGYSVLPGYLCAAEIEAGRLTVLHRPPMAPLNTLYLVSRAGAPPSAAVTAVQEQLLGVLQSWRR